MAISSVQPSIYGGIFGPGVTFAKLLGTVPSSGGHYEVLSIGNGESGALALVAHRQGKAPRVVKVGTSLFPLPKSVGAKVHAAVATVLAHDFLKTAGASSSSSTDLWAHCDAPVAARITAMLDAPVAGPPPTLDEKLLQSAQACDGNLFTGNVPGTDHGNLACAWAVNEVTRRATGQTISTELLSTDSVYDALQQGGRGVLLTGGPVPGCIIISPASGAVHGHVGIVGDSQVVYSNSSALEKFWHYYTLDSWNQHYNLTLHLQTYFFSLNPAQFP